MQLQRATSAADLQLRAIFTFGFSVGSAAYFLGCGVVPDGCPLVGEYVSEAFKVALAGVNVAVRSQTHVNERCRAGFDA